VTGSGSEDGYSEDRVALRWPVVLLLVGLPVLGVVVPPGVGLPLLVIWSASPASGCSAAGRSACAWTQAGCTQGV